MANYCEFAMVIYGTKDSIHEWKELMDDYSKKNHFYRIFENDLINFEKIDENLYRARFEGYCAWSIYTCCIDGYCSEDLLAKNSKQLNVKVEIWSKEPGMCFAEHIIYNNGEQICNDCFNYSCWIWERNEFPTYEEFKAEYKNAPPEEEFDDFGYCEIFECDNFGEFEIDWEC